jgi:hypothetical protein
MNSAQAIELKNTLLWEEFCNEIDKKVSYEMQRLTTVAPEDLKSVQMMVASLQSIKNIPQDVIDREEPASAT